jgi:hypothetical protein
MNDFRIWLIRLAYGVAMPDFRTQRQRDESLADLFARWKQAYELPSPLTATTTREAGV